MFTVTYFDSDNRYRVTSFDDLDAAVRWCRDCQSTTMRCNPISIEDCDGRKYATDGTRR